ncbi:MAG: transposase, partial [Paraburkholderia fungorum]|nr:transposase [Paraburkholderia fungorum]
SRLPWCRRWVGGAHSIGYQPYNTIADANGLVHLGCWAHCRRYFVEAEAALPKEARGRHQPASQFIHLIGKLYAAESHANDKPHWRARLRRRYSRAVLAQIKTLLDQHLETTAPKGLLGPVKLSPASTVITRHGTA